MNEIEWIKSLVRPGEPSPKVDVADDVLRDIRRHQRPMMELSPLAALIATLAGATVIFFAIQAWMAFQDPLAGFVDSWKMVLQ